jgi:hypothetical protein
MAGTDRLARQQDRRIPLRSQSSPRVSDTGRNGAVLMQAIPFSSEFVFRLDGDGRI